ncbi:MAG TPA: hypothetical protein VH619_15160 [Verrucomicrobiae bacterium]|jgi:hypothetical protein|nr:hypothetical protein [Verrucomicrobiae bacterium]
MNECDPLKPSDLNYLSKNKIPVAIIEPRTGNIKVAERESEGGGDDWENSIYVNSSGNQLTPLDDYW